MNLKSKWNLTKWIFAAIGLLLILSLTACSASVGADLEELKTIKAACPAGPKNLLVLLDASTSSAGQEIYSARISETRTAILTSSICGGKVRVATFGSSRVDTSDLVNETVLLASGGNANARLWSGASLAGKMLMSVKHGYKIEIAEGPGSDPLSMLSLVGEAKSENPEPLEALVLTDGIQTEGINLNVELTELDAITLANSLVLPDLTGVSLTISGIGRSSGKPAPSTYVAALKAFWETVCSRTNATCSVRTDLSN